MDISNVGHACRCVSASQRSFTKCREKNVPCISRRMKALLHTSLAPVTPLSGNRQQKDRHTFLKAMPPLTNRVVPTMIGNG